jgi:hypothetical protein
MSLYPLWEMAGREVLVGTAVLEHCSIAALLQCSTAVLQNCSIAALQYASKVKLD